MKIELFGHEMNLSLKNIFSKFTRGPSVIDFSFEKRSYGHNFNLIRKKDSDGLEWTIAVWYAGDIHKGDVMILGVNKNQSPRYRVNKITACGNPEDMYFIECSYTKKKIDEN